MKRVEANFNLNFTTENTNELPNRHQIENDLQERFARVLDSYLHSKNIEGKEVHFITCDDLTIEEYDD